MSLTDEQKAANYAKRRPRGTKGRGPKIIPQDRDCRALLTVFDLHYATTELLRQLHAPDTSPGTWSERIGKLVDHPNDYLDYSPQNKDNVAKYRAPLIVQITPNGIQLLIEREYITAEQAAWRRSFLIDKPQDFWHDVEVGNIIGSIMIALKDHPSKRFVTPWAIAEDAENHNLFLRIAEDHYVKTDYLFAIGHADGDDENYRYLILEHDRGTEQFSPKEDGGSSLGGKLNDLKTIFELKLYRKLNIPLVSVLTTITKPGRVKTALDHVSSFGSHKKRFAFKAIDITKKDDKVPLPIPSMVMEPWTRAGSLPPLPIDTLF